MIVAIEKRTMDVGRAHHGGCIDHVVKKNTGLGVMGT
jgi:hypothetical protein